MNQDRLFKIFKNLNRSSEVLKCLQLTSQWMDLTQAYLGVKTLAYPYTFATRSGERILLNTFHDLVTVWIIFFRGEYPIPENTKIAVDAGANIGTFSVYATSKGVEEVHALEPFPETYSLLQNNIALNNLEDRVHLKAIALADETGQRNMDLASGPSQSRGLLGDDDQEGLSVSISTLEDFIQSTGHDEIDLLKIDIEGAEHQVFQSADKETIRKFKHIVMEYHPLAPKEGLFAKIQDSGFQLNNDYFLVADSGVAYFSRL